MSTTTTAPTERPEAPKRGVHSRWLARAGTAAFLFFLIKGLLWLAVPGVIAVMAMMD